MTEAGADEARVLARIDARLDVTIEEIRAAIRQPSVGLTGEGIAAMAARVRSYLDAFGGVGHGAGSHGPDESIPVDDVAPFMRAVAGFLFRSAALRRAAAP